jgi:hypothetical protein
MDRTAEAYPKLNKLPISGRATPRASLGVSVDERIPLRRSIVGNGDGVRRIETPDEANYSSADDLLGFRMA